MAKYLGAEYRISVSVKDASRTDGSERSPAPSRKRPTLGADDIAIWKEDKTRSVATPNPLCVAHHRQYYGEQKTGDKRKEDANHH